MYATVALGPKGGLEFRLWTERGTFFVVGKYKALPHMNDAEKARMAELEISIKSKKDQRNEADSFWRSVVRGG